MTISPKFLENSLLLSKEWESHFRGNCHLTPHFHAVLATRPGQHAVCTARIAGKALVVSAKAGLKLTKNKKFKNPNE